MKKHLNPKHAALTLAIGVFGAAFILSILSAVTIGAVKVSFSDVYRIVLYNVSFGQLKLGDEAFLMSGTMYEIVWNLRMPRVLMGAVIGVLLSMCGVVMQATVQNPLADPYILGISSGASLGATFSIMIGASAVFTGMLATMGTAFWAFAGALAAMSLVMLLAHMGGGGRVTSAKLVLAGCVVGSLCSAFTNMMIYIGKDAENMKTVTYWLLGSMVSARWPKLTLPGICAAAGFLFFLTQLRTLNTLLLGDEAAMTLGVNLSRWRRVYMIITSLLSAVAVCTCGIVGFVGLMIPHIVRGFAGSDHRFLVPLASFSGGIFLIWADVLARIMIKNTEIPLGVITSAIGARDGCCIVCGTGTSLFARVNGGLHHIGGWGYLIDTWGSGYVLGREAIRAALRQADGRGPDTKLYKLVCDKLGAPPETSIPTIYAGGRPFIASFAGTVFAARKQGDAVAEAIFEQGAESLAEFTHTAERYFTGGFDVVLSGGIFAAFPEYAQAVQRKGSARANMIRPEVPPVCGCALENVLAEGPVDEKAFRAVFMKDYMQLKK